MGRFPEEFPSWAPVFFTVAGAALLILGGIGYMKPNPDPLPGQEHSDVKLLVFGGVWFVAGIIWWKKSNYPLV